MEGLLNFIKSPAGQGLLAAVAGGMAGAQRGTPWNNVGRGLVTGIQGYSGALDQESRAAQAAQAQEMQALQRQQMEMNMAAAQRQQQEAEAARAAQQQFIERADPQANALANPFAGEEGPSIPQVDPFQQQMYQAMQAGILPPQDWLKSQAPKQPEAFTLSPGQVRFQGDQKVAELQERQDPNKPFLGIDPATGQPIPNLAYQRYDLDKAARSAARVSTSVDARNMGTIPPGHRLIQGQDGSYSMEMIPGSPAYRDEQKAREAQGRQQELTARQLNPTIDDITTARKLASSGLIPSTGIGVSGLRNVPVVGQRAENLAATIDAIGSGISLENLNQMRQASPTGGALGNVSDKQSGLLAEAFGSLRQSQSKDLFLYNLSRVENVLNDIVHGPGNGPERHDLKKLRQGNKSPDSDRPKVGTVVDGYRYKGGDPANKANWVKQ
jgi:hypothetical protein